MLMGIKIKSFKKSLTKLEEISHTPFINIIKQFIKYILENILNIDVSNSICIILLEILFKIIKTYVSCSSSVKNCFFLYLLLNLYYFLVKKFLQE